MQKWGYLPSSGFSFPSVLYWTVYTRLCPLVWLFLGGRRNGELVRKIGVTVAAALQGLIGYGGRFLFGLLFLCTVVVQTVLRLPKGEWADVLPNTVWTFLVLIGLLAVAYLSRGWLKRFSNRQVFIAGCLLYLLAGLGLIFFTTDVTRYDAAAVFRSAVEMNAGDYQSLEAGGYLYRYPHQLGLVSFECLVLTIIPIPNATVFFVLNLAMVLGINWTSWQLADRLFANRSISRYTLLLSFAFLPQLFNILFVYGLIFGLFFASFGLLFLVDYLQKQRMRDAVWATIFLVLSYWIRNNYIILLVAVALVLCLEFLKKGNKQHLLLLLAIISFAFGLNKATTAYYSSVSGQDLRGMPKISWLAMGLQDVPNDIRQPGWYNYYVRDIYKETDGDYAAIEVAAKTSLAERLAVFAKDPLYALDFFRIKLLTTWTEASFESIFSGPSKWRMQPHRTDLLKDLYQGGNSYILLYQWFHPVLMLIYGGAALFLWLRKPKEEEAIHLYPYLFLAGGLVFHLLWETKSQYVSPHVYLLIPFAAAAYVTFWEKWQSRKEKTSS